MNIKIFKNGEHINTIVSDEMFAKEYCDENGYTYELPPSPLTEAEIQSIKIKAISDRQDFLEDCIAEMAGQVYS